MKKFANLLLALTLAGWLTACGGGGKNSTSSGSANQAPTQVVLVEASSINAGSIGASWLTAADDSTESSSITYQLHASLDPTFTPAASTKVFEGKGVTVGSTDKLIPGQSYTVRLVAVDEQGASTTSDAITVAVSETNAELQSGVQVQVLPVSQIANVTSTSFDWPAAVVAPAVGSVVASTDANDGQGFLRKVTSVSTTGAVTTVQTVQAALDEVFSALDLSSNVTLSAVPAPVAAASLDGGRARILAYSAQGEATYQAYHWDNGLQYRAAVGVRRPLAATAEKVSKVFTGTTGFSVTDTLDVKIDPKVEFKAKVGLLTSPYARLVVHTAPRIDQHLTLEATGAGTLDVTQSLIVPRKFRQVLRTPAGIPIIISGTLEINMRIQGSVSGALIADEEFTLGFADLSAGFEYRNGQFTPITSIVPEYSLRYGGNGKATADLKISLLPSLSLTGYEVLTGKVVLQPYLTGTAGIEGQVQIGAFVNFDSMQAGLPADADFRLTAARLSTGTNAWLYGDLHVFSKTIVKYPIGADPTDFTTLKPFELLSDQVLADLPALELTVADGATLTMGKDIVVTATARNFLNPLKSIFPSLPESFIAWQTWTAPRLIPPVGVTTGYKVTGVNGSYVVNVTEPGKYILRAGGHSYWGTWARQYTEIELLISDFTKISAAGEDLPANAPTWSCVRHNATGLLWEAHVTRQTPRHRCTFNSTYFCTGYTNFGDSSQYDASAVPPTVTNLCGTTGWRLPTKAEVDGLVAEPAYQSNPFNTWKNWFGIDDTALWGWTSSRSSVDYVWGVNFGIGFVYDNLRLLDDGDYNVRLVAGTSIGSVVPSQVPVVLATPTGDFTKVSASGSDLPPNATTWSCVRHNTTGVLWEAHVTRQTPRHRCAFNPTYFCTGYTNFGDGRENDASTVPATVGSLCGKIGWRLPTKAEVDVLAAEPSYRSNPFQTWKGWFGADDSALWGWTSTPQSPDYAFGLNFGIGFVFDNLRLLDDGDYSVRLVVGP